MLRVASTVLLLMAVAAAHPSLQQIRPPPRPLRIIAFGAHPDDAELKASGVAALWAAAGHKVKFVAMTNGDVGHFAQAGGPLAKRRKAEVAECRRILGIETEVLDIHDGELMPSSRTGKKVAGSSANGRPTSSWATAPRITTRIIATPVCCMEDAAVVVVAPFFAPDTRRRRATRSSCTTRTASRSRIRSTPIIVVGIDAVGGEEVEVHRARCRRSSGTRIRGRRARCPTCRTGDRERQPTCSTS